MTRGGGLRMRDFWRGRITPRELLVFIRHLPADSQFVKALAPDEAEIASYGREAHLLMDLFDATVGKAGAYPRPAEALAKRREKERLIALLEAQAERNRVRDEREGVSA